jgi:hypothetical protein
MTIIKAVKKPIEVEAVKWQYFNKKEIDEFSGFNWTIGNNKCLFILTLEGEMKANVGDWIIKGVNGEFYPCKDDIFKKTYNIIQEKNDLGDN